MREGHHQAEWTRATRAVKVERNQGINIRLPRSVCIVRHDPQRSGLMPHNSGPGQCIGWTWTGNGKSPSFLFTDCGPLHPLWTPTKPIWKAFPDGAGQDTGTVPPKSGIFHREVHGHGRAHAPIAPAVERGGPVMGLALCRISPRRDSGTRRLNWSHRGANGHATGDGTCGAPGEQQQTTRPTAPPTSTTLTALPL